MHFSGFLSLRIEKMRTLQNIRCFSGYAGRKNMGNLFSKFFGTVGVIDSIRVTLVMSFWSTLIASMLGIFLGLVLEQTKFPGKKLVVRVNRTLMGAPPVVIGLLTYMLLRKKGPFGALRWVFTIKGMVAARF